MLAHDELLVELVVPAPGARSGGNYLRHTPRRELDIAVVGVASQLTLSNGVCAKARIALAAVAPTPVRATAAEQALEGQPVTPELIERAAELAVGAAQPISDQRGLRGLPASPGPRPDPPHPDHGPGAGRPLISRRNCHVAKHTLSCTINDDAVEVLVQPYETLLDALRETLGLTGPKEGCGTGDCGACTVHLDGKPIASCLMLAMQVRGRAVRTIEGLGRADALHPLQDAFVRLGVPAVRVLHPRRPDGRGGPARREPAPHGVGNPLRHRGQSLPVHRVHQDAGGHHRGRRRHAAREGA